MSPKVVPIRRLHTMTCAQTRGILRDGVARSCDCGADAYNVSLAKSEATR